MAVFNAQTGHEHRHKHTANRIADPRKCLPSTCALVGSEEERHLDWMFPSISGGRSVWPIGYDTLDAHTQSRRIQCLGLPWWIELILLTDNPWEAARLVTGEDTD